MTLDLFADVQGVLVPNNLSGTQGRFVDDSPRASRHEAAPSQNSFDGSTFVPELDRTRLKAQLVRVRELMRDGLPRTLSQIADATGDPESSVSARLRDLRKPRYGMWTVCRKRLPNGLHMYWLGAKGL